MTCMYGMGMQVKDEMTWQADDDDYNYTRRFNNKAV